MIAWVRFGKFLRGDRAVKYTMMGGGLSGLLYAVKCDFHNI